MKNIQITYGTHHGRSRLSAEKNIGNEKSFPNKRKQRGKMEVEGRKAKNSTVRKTPGVVAFA